MVSPAKFIPLVEENGLIVRIGEWALKQACLQSRQWQKLDLPSIRIAVNLSPRQFQQENLIEMVRQCFVSTGLDTSRIELEITEGAAMQDIEQTIVNLSEFREMGLKLSIDDYGTGYSSLSYLKRFPVHALKIDQSFVRHLTETPEDQAIVASTITLAHALSLKVIAEGVENAEQLEYLSRHGCDEIQGYYVSRPLPADEFRALWERNTKATKPATIDRVSEAKHCLNGVG